MPITPNQLDELALSLLRARQEHRFHPRPSELGWELSLEQAYAVQLRQRALMGSADPERAIKLGLTSLDQRVDAGYDGPSFGFLTESMIIPDGGELVLAHSLAPKVEPEIVVVLGTALQAPPETRRELMECIRSVHAGMEIVDSRYSSGGFFLTDAVADNSSAHAGLWASAGLPADRFDWAGIAISLTVDGQLRAEGTGAAVMGDPLLVVHEVIRERLLRGFGVPEGLAVFTGNAAPPAVPVRAGNHVTADFGPLGSVSLRVVAEA